MAQLGLLKSVALLRNLLCRQLSQKNDSYGSIHKSMFHSSSAQNSRGTKEQKKSKNIQEVTIRLSDADKSKDYIGPADPVSNLRQISFRTENQSQLEQNYHKQCEQVMRFNEEFWKRHNISFIKEKESFVNQRLKEKTNGETTLSAEEMSEFYKEFLNKNHKSHIQYNMEWYKKNISLLLPAFKVAMHRLLRRLGVM